MGTPPSPDAKLLGADRNSKDPFYTGIGHSSWVLAQRPGMGVMLNPYRGPVTGLLEWSGRALALSLD